MCSARDPQLYSLNTDAVWEKEQQKWTARVVTKLLFVKTSRETRRLYHDAVFSEGNKSPGRDCNGFIYLTVLPTNIKQPQY